MQVLVWPGEELGNFGELIEVDFFPIFEGLGEIVSGLLFVGLPFLLRTGSLLMIGSSFTIHPGSENAPSH
jgi:hypothetical protein